MTSFTTIPEGTQCKIKIDAQAKVAKINRNIYGGFTERTDISIGFAMCAELTASDMGRCIYGGIYDPSNPLSDEKGHRKDVKAALQELEVPVIRYPGGNCAQSITSSRPLY